MEAKEMAAREALKFVESGQVVGLGSGGTVSIFVNLLGEKVRKEKLKVKCVASSKASEKIAIKNKLKVADLNEVEKIDLAIDGADQVDRNLDLVKGYGGALLREKVIDYRARKFVVIVDESKIRPVLGGRIPLEVLPFGSYSVKKELLKLGVRSSLRKIDKKIFLTDNRNWILDAEFESLENPKEMEVFLKSIPGVMEVGIFTKNICVVIVGSENKVKILEKRE
jgi:ribose 5-phosphate isomerase A